MIETSATAANGRLVELSCRDRKPDPLDWPARLGPDCLCFAPELVSLAGTAAFAALDRQTRHRLALFEAANFFSLNIHGERHLIAGLAQRLYGAGVAEHSEYLHHFLAEENRHAAMFAAFCRRYAGKIYADRALPLAGDDGADRDLMFFARIAVFEEIIDTYNRAMARDPRLVPIARAIHRAHHRDEARHLAFGHRLLRELVALRQIAWTGDDRARVAQRLAGFAEHTWKALFNPAVYADAGLADPHGLRRTALASDAAGRRRDWSLRGCRRLLARLDLAGGGTP